MHIFNLYESPKKFKLNKIFRLSNGGAFKSKDYVDFSKSKLITIKNVDDNGFNTHNVDFLTDRAIDEKFLLKIGDIVITMTGNVGRVGIVDEYNCYLNQRLLRVKASSSLYTYLYFKKYRKDIELLARGTAQKNLSLIDLQNTNVYNSATDIYKFSKYDYLFNLLLQNKLKIKKLKSLKQILLSKYFD